MGIETLYADGIEQAYRRGLTSPAPQADPDFRTFGFLASGLSGIPRGAMEVLSSVRDLSAESERQFRESPRGRIVAQEYERRTGVKPADQYRMPGGASIRQAAEYNLAPDPQTSHMAEQVFHGLTRFGTKAVGAVVAAGPVGGAALLGAEETNTIYRDLIGRGIDSETALKVAAVQGAISAAGVVLPVSAAGLSTALGKVAGTAALVGVGGPGAYVAQETLARDILQRAGYADEAGRHDPADPLGLALSTILPAAFGAVSLRGALRTPKQIGPIKTEAGVRDAVQLTPEEQAASDAYERSAANLGELRQEIARTKDPAARQVLEAELAKQTEAAAQAGRGAVAESAARSPEVVDAARVKVLRETVQRSLPDGPDALLRLHEAMDAVAAGERVDVPDFATRIPNLAQFVESGRWKAVGAPKVADVPDEFIGWLKAAGGVSMDQKFDITGERSAILSNPGGIFKRGGMGTDELASRAAEAGFLSPEQAGQGVYLIDLIKQRIRGEPVLSASQIELQAERTSQLRGMEDRLTDLETRLRMLGEDPAAARGNPEAMEAYLQAHESRLLAARVGEIGRPVADDSPEMDALRERAQQIAQDIRDTDRTLDQYETELEPLSPVMRSLVREELDAATTPQAANPEAAAPARGAGDDAPPGVPEPGRAAADVQAAGRAVTPAQAERQIAEALAVERPSLPVTLPGTNEAVPLADAMEMIRAQRALDESDAELLRAAVLCDLSP